ncbi:FAD-dependent oxidoreductase [Dielma fastidiosa]|uniref:Urocanate reductase n=1 Tax=Dielma fastidiosa TaxID=1034346 RepID=A0A318L0G8_9FIRM|nr:FAD-dependent oxidoreductase [Dielma fastidiosa]PXX81416.1 fumarate reductase flavoprotein subunit [Dielma fastidiosa]
MKRLYRRLSALAVCLMMTLALSACSGPSSSASIYKDGTYAGSAKGMNGDVTVEVKIASDKIESVIVTDHKETPGISDPAIETVPNAIVEKNSTEVDIVAGATFTSEAIINAVEQALEKASGKTVDENKEDEKQTLTFTDPDVIVIGGGFSGMNAALEASTNGAKVMLIEKNSDLGGSIRYAGGTLSGAGTKMQEAAGIEDTEENFIADIERMGGGINVPELTAKHVSKAAAAVDWMDSLGADFGDRIPTQPGSYDAFGIPREHRVSGKGQEMVAIVKPLLEEKVNEGVLEILLNTEVKDIIIEEGAVTGVILTDGTEYRSKSVILATGGYGHNETMLHDYNFENVLTDAPEFVTGDGYTFALKAGAVLNNMDYLPAYAGGVPVSDTGFVHSVTANNTGYPNTIWVDAEGQRHMNEFENLDSQKKAFWASAPHNIVWMIFDQKVVDNQEPILKKDENWKMFNEELAKGEVVFKADSVEELAKLINMDTAALQATIDAYNEGIETGTDPMGRTDERTPIDSTLYAVKTIPYVMLTKGGPLMNTSAQTLDKDAQPIPGLFQCGELTGGANVGGGANIGGLANTSCIVWGKIAGINAANYALNGTIVEK